MERDEIIAVAQELAGAQKPFVLATVGEDGGPRMRWMGGLMLEDSLTIYMAGAANARKMDQVRDNPLAQLMFHADNFAQVVTIFGACAVVDDPDIKDKLWEAMPVLGRYFSGPEDPHFGVLRFDPKRIELLAMQEHELGPEVVEL